MSVSTDTSRALHQTLGDEAADEMVNWMHHMEQSRVEFRELLELSFSRQDDRMALQFSEFRRAMQREFSEFRDEVRKDAAGLRNEMTDFRADVLPEVAKVNLNVEQRHVSLMKWSLVYWAGAVGAIAGLARIIR